MRWPEYSPAKCDVLLEMGRLYPMVQIVLMYKIKQPDGTVLRGGKTVDRNIYPFLQLANLYSLKSQRDEAAREFEAVVMQKIGRPPRLDELRVAFRPMMETFRSVFVDDVTPAAKANILIETSADNWQAHYYLSREVTRQEAALIQRHQILSVGGDPAAGSPVQARRFPEGRFMFNPNRPALDIDTILAEVSAVVPGIKPLVCGAVSDEENWTPEALEQLYIRLQNGRTDLSSCDMSFCVYLASKGLDDVFIEEALRITSPDIERRHPALYDYLSRTIQKALLRTSF